MAAGFFLRMRGAGPPFGVVEGGPEGGPAGEALMASGGCYVGTLSERGTTTPVWRVDNFEITTLTECTCKW